MRANAFYGDYLYDFIEIIKVFNPNLHDRGFTSEKVNTGQKISLSLVAAYNQSDSSIGWYHFLAGMTGTISLTPTHFEFLTPTHLAFFSDSMEKTLESTYSVNMPPETVPILSMQQVHTTKLGYPYSVCMK